MEGLSAVTEIVILVLAVLGGVLFGSFRRGCPVLAIFGRWIFWICGSIAVGLMLRYFGFSERPLWTLASLCFLLWFLVETLYSWVAIDAMSHSELPLFPKFSVNERGNEWPASRRFIELREKLRKQGMHNAAALVAELAGETVMRCPIYESDDHLLRLQLFFLPHRSGSIQVCYSLMSIGEDGRRVVTDNLFLPFGGFYPEDVFLERRPWRRSLKRLMRHHQKRVKRLGLECVPWDGDAAQDLNAQQRELERINTRLGYLMPPQERAEHGKISPQGRYQLWKELWMLRYLGRPKGY